MAVTCEQAPKWGKQCMQWGVGQRLKSSSVWGEEEGKEPTPVDILLMLPFCPLVN